MARHDQAFYFNEAIEKKLAFARGVKSRGHVYVSGCASTDSNGVVGIGDMALQIKTVYAQIEAILTQHGLTFEHVIKEVMYTTDMKAFIAAGDVRAAVYQNVAPPAATGVEVTALVHPDMMVEIEVIAELPE